MRRLLVVVAAALLFAPAAAAVAPAGFRESPALEPAASFVAGKPIRVWCGLTWLGDVYEGGYAQIGGSDVYITTSLACAPLERLAAHQPVVSKDAGLALGILVHEAEHAKGIADETDTECAALKIAAEVGIRFFGLRGQRRYLRSLMAAAWAQREELPPQYNTHACF